MKKSFRTVSGGGGQIPGCAWRRPRPLTREFPTNSGVGVSARQDIKKAVPKDSPIKKSSTQITLNAAEKMLLFACWNCDFNG